MMCRDGVSESIYTIQYPMKIVDLIQRVRVSFVENIKLNSKNTKQYSPDSEEMHSSLYVGSNQGTPSMHVGTTPGTAGPASMSGGGSLAPGGFQAGSFQPRRRVNQTIGQLTNYSIPWTTIMRRMKNKGDQYIQKGQLVFKRCTKTPDPRSSKQVETLLNLPLLNYFLAMLSTDARSRDAYNDEISAAQIASEYVPHGVLLNALGDDGREERVVVSTVRGFVDTFNIWGNDIYDGDSLYLVYKEIEVSTLTPYRIYSFDFSGTRTTVNIPTGVQKIWQVIPVACRGDSEPSLAYLTNGKVASDPRNDTVGAFHGLARYIGRVQHARHATGRGMMGRSRSESVCCNLNEMTNLSQMTIFIDH